MIMFDLQLFGGRGSKVGKAKANTKFARRQRERARMMKAKSKFEQTKEKLYAARRAWQANNNPDTLAAYRQARENHYDALEAFTKAYAKYYD